MSTPTITTRLRARRTEAGLTQGDLAARVGVSRQAIVAIEAGRQVPSTAVALQLARLLRCRVEDLFGLAQAPRLTARLAGGGRGAGERLALGQVDGAWVAHPLTRPDQPGDAVRAGEPQADGLTAVEPLGDLAEVARNVLVAGCAPLLGVLAGRLGRRHGDARATWVPAHSTGALELLQAGAVHVAGLHLACPGQPGGHEGLVQQRFPGQTMTLVNLTRWRQGLVVAAGNPLGIEGVDDLLRPEVRFVGREPGAGAQQLVHELLRARGHGVEVLASSRLAADHDEVAQLVGLGVADAGVAIEASALARGLAFIPLVEERFDLLVPEARLAQPPVARLVELIDRPAFRADAGRLAGYDLSSAGHACTVA